MIPSGFAEAVTQKSFAAGLLLPHWHADVVGAKLIAGVAEKLPPLPQVGLRRIGSASAELVEGRLLLAAL